MSDNTPETGDAGAPAEKRARKPRVAKAAPPSDTPAVPAAPAPVAAAPSAPAPAPAAPPAPRNEPAQPPAASTPPALSQPQSHNDGPQESGGQSPQGQQGNPQGGQQQDGEPREGNNNRFQNNNQNNGGGNNNNRRDRFRNRRERNRDRFRDDGLPGDNGNETFVPRPHPNVPEGFPLEEGFRQVTALLRKLAPLVRERGIVIAIEPLRRAECNLINSFYEGCRLAEAVGDPAVRVLVDYYHFMTEAEPVSHILDEGAEYLRHTHFARVNGRAFPRDAAEDAAYRPFFDALRAVGYDARMSLEAYSPDPEAEAPMALNFFRQNL